jgi:hypothetical protein
MHDAATDMICLSIGGVPICLRNAPDFISTSLAKAFSMSRTGPAAGGVMMTAELLDDGAFLAPMPAFVRTVYDRQKDGTEPVAFSGPSGEFCVLMKNEGTASWARIDPSGASFHLSCQRLTTAKGPLHFQSVLIPALKYLLLLQGKLLLHAGAVATEDGRGLIFVGLSGAGKTTTCISLTRAGFSFLSDDLVVLSFLDGKARVEGIREHMNLTKQTLEFFPEFASYREEVQKAENRGKVPVNPEALFGKDRVRDRAVIDAISVIRIGKDGPQLMPVNPPAILNVILQNHTFETGLSIPRQSMDILWNILGAVRTFNLLTGPDPTAMGDHVFRQFHDGAPSRPVAVALQRKTAATASAALGPAEAAGLLKRVLCYTLDGEAGSPAVPPMLDAARLFRHHRLEAHLARWIKNARTELPVDGFDPDRVLTNAAALVIKRDGLTSKVHGALEDAGIRSLLLRGPAVAKRFYADETLRTYRDIDLIVPKERLTDAAGVLQRLGFKPDRNLGYWEQRGEWPFTGSDAIVELHWEAYPAPFHTTAGLCAADVWTAPDSIVVNGRAVGCLNTDHLLLSSLLHAAYDHQLDRLVRLVDIGQIVKQAGGSLDWDWIAGKVRETGTAVAIAKELDCLAEIMSVPVPPTLTAALKPPVFSRALANFILPNRHVILGRGALDRFRRKLFLRTLRFLI